MQKIFKISRSYDSAQGAIELKSALLSPHIDVGAQTHASISAPSLN
jgi:hypothetical protein